MFTKFTLYPSSSSCRSSATPKSSTFVAVCLESFGMVMLLFLMSATRCGLLGRVGLRAPRSHIQRGGAADDGGAHETRDLRQGDVGERRNGEPGGADRVEGRPVAVTADDQ